MATAPRARPPLGQRKRRPPPRCAVRGSWGGGGRARSMSATDLVALGWGRRRARGGDRRRGGARLLRAAEMRLKTSGSDGGGRSAGGGGGPDAPPAPLRPPHRRRMRRGPAPGHRPPPPPPLAAVPSSEDPQGPSGRATRQTGTPGSGSEPPPPRGVSPPRPIVLNFEQCIASPGPREETPDVPSDQGHESDVWLQLGLVEMPDSPRSEESTHSHLSSVPTVTNHSEGPGTPTTPFCDRITHTRGGRRSPSTSCSEHGSTETQTPPPAPDTAYNGDGNRSPSTSCSERGFS